MSDSPSDSVLQPYRDAVARHGAGFEATLWGSRRAQGLRFDVMIELVEFAGVRILDVGCGHGDFASHLAERAIPYATFIGLDAVPEVVEAAQTRALPRSSFEVADVLSDPSAMVRHAPDYITFSGTLNTMDDPTARRLLHGAMEACAQGIVFNFLSDRHHARWGDRDLTPARRFRTVDWIDWALTQTSRVEFTQSYLDGHDATIVMRHDDDVDEGRAS